MSQCLSLPAYLAIARMVERSRPFDVELALSLVQEVSRDLRLEIPVAGCGSPAPSWRPGGRARRRAGLARRGITAVIAEIDRRVGPVPGPLQWSNKL